MRKLQPNKITSANFLSLLSFWWLNDFFKVGSKRSLKEEDMLEVSKWDSSEELCNQLEKSWEHEIRSRDKVNPSMLRAVFRTFRTRLFLGAIGCFCVEFLRTTLAVLIAYLVKYFEEKESVPVWKGYAYAASVFVCALTLTIVHQQYFFMSHRMGWHMRTSLCALMYKKILLLSHKALNEMTTGHIVNLGATDVLRFDQLPTFVNYIWFAPIQCIAVGGILWWEVGPVGMTGLIFLVFLMMLQGMTGKGFAKLRNSIAQLTDDRIRIMNEVVTGIRIIKMYTWEKPFAKLVSEARRKEINEILVSSCIKAFNVTIFVTQEKFLTFATIIVLILTGGAISAYKVFILIGVYGAIRLSVGAFFLLGVEVASESIAALKRVEDFMVADEFVPHLEIQTQDELDDDYVELENFSGKWNGNVHNDQNKEALSLTLHGVSMRVDSAQLLAILGPVGAGKSSLLSAITRELPALSGNVSVRGNVAYSSQVPCVFSGTLRENIVFGERYDQARYKDVVFACCLTKDIQSLPDSDMTLVGERGVMLSGGQKARIGLARAVYRNDRNIYLLDDPLSAVDPEVARHIFDHCICGLLKSKVRILVTHQLQFLERVDRIVILKQGRILDSGTYEELRKAKRDFASLLRTKDEKSEKNREDVTTGLAHMEAEQVDDNLEKNTTSGKFNRNSLRGSRKSLRSIASLRSVPEVDMEEEIATAVEPEEIRMQGSIGWRVYLEYLKAGTNGLILVFLLLVTVGNYVLLIISDWWLTQWTLHYENHMKISNNRSTFYPWNSTYITTTSGNGPILNQTDISGNDEIVVIFDHNQYFKIYVVICCTMLLVTFLRVNGSFYLCVSSGVNMHRKMFQAILRAPIRFFDINPVGRVLNRFSKDMGQVDEILPRVLVDFVSAFSYICGVIILVSVINYVVLIIVLPCAIYFIWLRGYYIRTSRDIKRLEGTCRSPVFSLVSSTLQGLMTVRAFQEESHFKRRFHEAQDLHGASWFLFIAGSRWLSFRLDLLSAFFVGSLSILSVAAASILDIGAGEVGLILTYAASTISLFQWTVRQSTVVENLMTSVERIQQYYGLDAEAPEEIPNTKPPENWPIRGAIEFNNVSFAHYKNGPMVLKNLSIKIRGKEKIGLVGRTGAGKSSIIAALFRISDFRTGEIFIDGIATSTLGLKKLRSALSIIPQDPILFSGSLRRNLDPFDEYSDEEVWNALKQVQLEKYVRSFPGQLVTKLSESGSNFSVGQRQLVCLARAILRRNKILLIDEATANVDIRTDGLIQATIREKFESCTVITIAHRINTIIDSDRIIVLESGIVKEFDAPHVLLQNQSGHFTSMVTSMGEVESASLRKTAKEVYTKRLSK